MLLEVTVDGTSDHSGPEAPQRAPPARSLQDGPLGGDQPALVIAALEGTLERPHDAHVRVTRTLASPLLTDFEQRVDPAVARRSG